MEKSSDLETKYQKLAAEYSKVCHYPYNWQQTIDMFCFTGKISSNCFKKGSIRRTNEERGNERHDKRAGTKDTQAHTRNGKSDISKRTTGKTDIRTSARAAEQLK